MLTRGMRWIIGFPLLLALAALIYVYVVQPRWEATSTIQIGRIGEIEAGRTASVIESPTQAIERMKLRAFQDRVLKRLGIDPDHRNRNARLYRDSIGLRAVVNTDFVELKVQGFSMEDALRYVEATVAELRETHDALARPTIEYLRAQLTDVNRSLERARDERAKLVSSIPLGLEIGPGNRFAENVLLGNALTARDGEIRALQERQLMLEERLSPTRTRPTSLAGVHVPPDPKSPKKLLTVLLAAACGLVAGVLFALIRPRWARNDAATPPG